MLHAISAMHLEHILCQSEADRDILRHNRLAVWIIAGPPWQIVAIGSARIKARRDHQLLVSGRDH